MAGLWLPPAELAALCSALAALGGLLLARAARHRTARTARPAVGHQERAGPPRATGRSFPAALGISLMLAAAAAAHSATSSSQRFEGPLADAVTAGKSVVAIVEVAGNPRAMAGPGGSAGRWAVPVWTQEVTTGGMLVRTRARLTIMGGQGWGGVVPGQTLRAAGKLRPAEPGDQDAGTLAASTAPGKAMGGSLLEGAAKELRPRFVSAAVFLSPDARGLLPGMVTGDTSALDEGLDNAMKAVGMTHLTAVSGVTARLRGGCVPQALETFGVRSMRPDAGTPTTARSQPIYHAYGAGGATKRCTSNSLGRTTVSRMSQGTGTSPAENGEPARQRKSARA